MVLVAAENDPMVSVMSAFEPAHSALKTIHSVYTFTMCLRRVSDRWRVMTPHRKP
jgi:hypothetical protein